MPSLGVHSPWYKAIKCKSCSEITVESGTQLKTVHICSVDYLASKLPEKSKYVIGNSALSILYINIEY